MKCLLTAFVMIALLGCGAGERYEVQGDVVVFTYWTFSFGRINDTLPGADASSFKSVKDWLGHDNERVYFKEKLVPGADVATLQVVRYPLYRDKRDYYYGATAMHVADMETFKTLKWAEDDFWATDSRYAYYDTLRIDADLPTFELLDVFVAKDKNHVYFFGQILPEADAATFEKLGHSAYSRDKSHVWCGDDLLPDADLATFVVDGFDKPHDKHGRFRYEKRDTVTEDE